MTRREAVEYVHSLGNFGSKPGLERVTALCRALGDPQDRLRFIHIAGTNGKGSTATMISNMLIESGLNVGSFTSPFVYRFNERICVGGKPIPDRDLTRLLGAIKPIADAMEDHVTEFEVITALGFLYFAERGCDVVVLEVGLGGRLDATNVIKKPELSVITGIALDHTAILGDTVAQIAAEKAGIIKPGAPVVCGEMPPEALEVIKNTAADKGSPVIAVDPARLTVDSLRIDGCDFSIAGYGKPFNIRLAGIYQPHNALTAVTAAEILGIDERFVRSGLKKARWRARFETLSREPTVIYDGAHNPQGVEAAVETVKAVFGGGKVVLLTGVMADKDYIRIARLFSQVACAAVCVTPDNPRALDASELAQVYRRAGVEAYAPGDLKSSVELALRMAKERGCAVLAAGTLYMYADFVRALSSVLTIADEGDTMKT